MANKRLPEAAGGEARPESNLSQVLAHGPAMSMAYGKLLGGLIMMTAILKASRGPLGIIAAISVVGTLAYRFWPR
jgi:hypothetical protein